jgi:hypothetical protein
MRIDKYLNLSLVLLILAIITASLAHAHGSSPGTATLIGFDSDTIGLINSTGKEDYFLIDSPYPGTLTISSSGLTNGLDPYGILFASDGSTQLATDDNYSGSNFRIAHTISAGQYYIMVGAVSNTVGGYALKVRVTPTDDHGNISSSATGALPNSVTSGYIETIIDEDYFEVMLFFAGTLTATTTGSTDTYGYLSDFIDFNITQDDDSGSNKNFYITKYLNAGIYYIKVQTYHQKTTGPYTLSLTYEKGIDSTGSQDKTSCFIATAAYGSFMHSDVMALRQLRDDYLLKNHLGRELVSLYYEHSPALADFIARHDALRLAARVALKPVVYLVEYPVLFIPAIVLLPGALFYVVRRKKKLKLDH